MKAGRLKPVAGAELESLASVASRLILAGRLGRVFPDPYLCSDYLRALAPSFHGGAHAGVEVDLGSGLPGMQHLVDVWADCRSAPDFIREMEHRLGLGRSLPPGSAARLSYYRRLVALDLKPLTRVAVALRRVDREAASAFFEVVFDRFDPAEQVFVRHTLMLEQAESGRRGALIDLAGDYSRQTSELRDKLEKFAGDDSEIAFLLMGRLPGVRVEEVVRARIGPLWSEAAPAPEGWREGGCVLHLPVDRASTSLREDRDDDPFSGIYRHFLSEVSRSIVEEEARRLGYRVHKDRKFACEATVADGLRRKLAEAGTRNLIYTV
ncbi:MAG: hypothetical protein HY924_10180 [Elusimicrobia bacterium]|nr:hypothetical protein [Elusimicrobiota bacterium]